MLTCFLSQEEPAELNLKEVLTMKPNWMDDDKKEAQARKARVMAKQPMFNEDVQEDQEREEGFHSLMEVTGNTY